MKILAIRGKNLASLAGEFEIDFQSEPLAGAGLFAICGPTGAGKSTLLDALCLALYDATPRLTGADGRGIELPDVGKETTLPNDRRNILRRGATEAHAEVDFVGNDGIACRARWSVRRARSRIDGKLQPAEMSLVRVADQQPVCGHLKSEVQKAIVERIGLSFEQFTRAVLLAQNEFFTFLKAGEDERAALLQTLTGTDRFEHISRRAFERNKAEQDKLRTLRERLDDQQPLTADERAATETERAAALAAVGEYDKRREALAARLRWHEEHDRLRLREAEAHEAVAQSTARRAAAGERRALLARVEAAQAARPLRAEVERLARERSVLAAQRTELATTLAAATHTATGAGRAEQQARGALAEAETAQAGLAPLLGQARQLDTEIAALAPRRAKAATAEAEARAAADTLKRRLVATETARGAARQALEATSAWLGARRDLARLAEAWTGWDALLAAASEEHRREQTAAAEVDRLCAQGGRDAEAIEAAASRHAAAAAARVERENEARAAADALQGFDAEVLARKRAELEARAEALNAAEQARRELAHARRQAAELDSQAKLLREGREPLQQALAAACARRPVTEAAADQAERAWKLVFEASRADVETLRSRLEPARPCPVCGSLEHPYVARHPAFDDALAHLAAERDRCRQVATETAVEAQTLEDRLKVLAEQLAGLDARLARIAGEETQAGSAWTTCASALAARWTEALPATGDEEGWLAARAAELRAARVQADAEDARHRQAAARLQAAQGALDAARSAEAAAQDTLARLRTEAGRTEAGLAAARDALAAGRQRLAAILDQLDAARPPAPGTDCDWRSAWRADPAGYRASCGAAAVQWQEKKQAAQALEQDAARLQTEAQGLADMLAQGELRQRQAAADLTELDRALETLHAARRPLLVGQGLTVGAERVELGPLGVEEIERVLARVRDGARAELARRQDATKAADAERTRLEATTAQLAKQAHALDADETRAAAALERWLAEFNAEAGGPALDAAGLGDLLARDVGWIAVERAALSALDTALASAEGGLAQIVAQRAAHDEARPAAPADEDGAEAIQRALAELADVLRDQRERLGRLELALRGDDEVRTRAAALVEAIGAQEAQARVWWQMNELIGAADGKKFRNYAQQLTLDVLLGYANAHLRDLARRYRLERVPNSLALMVIDQDMGEEQRSVHSLSGGESFLVSLALALGLASLSSHRVRVESLFIDEGFGSLDADTLRVAMDALDRLQALGRKVGVISHVEEMTERIGTRIHVRRLAGGRSEIVVDSRA